MNNYTDEQQTFINYREEKSIILSATAGSGKTHSTVGRVNRMIEDGVDPKRIILFSFTNDAVNELRSRIKHDVKITTIHSFTSSLLGKMGLFRPIVTFYDFTNWYREKYRPKPKDPLKVKQEYAKTVDKFYEEGAYISATFSAYKLQKADNLKVIKPLYYDSYIAFLKETKSRDFSDMLIDTEKCTKNPKYSGFFENLYDYIFVDEYQDTSTLQMKILLAIKAKQYHLIGDKNQSIYGFSGANCDAIEALLTSNHDTVRMTLTKNFRSSRKIVENSNKYSDLEAVPFHENDGYIHEHLISENELYDMIEDGKPLAILVRTNNVIKDIEEYCLTRKFKMRYFNYITEQDKQKIKENKINQSLKRKLDKLIPYFGSSKNLIDFIDENAESDVFVTSIHKSKGREFQRCVVVNSIDPDFVKPEQNVNIDDYTFITESGEIDTEARNIHYVAVTRPKEELYFLIY